MIVNLSRHDYCLVQELQTATTFWRRLRGLLFRATLPAGFGLLLSPCQSVHTLQMRFAIDVLFLDKGWRVVGLEQNLRPWRFSRCYRDAWFVLECPAGTILQSSTSVGDWLACA